MKQWLALTLAILVMASLAACGCQNSNMGSNTTNTTAATTETTQPAPKATEPILDPTILDPTFETNIPDEQVNENSTNSADNSTNQTDSQP